jgi:hypothetical protein
MADSDGKATGEAEQNGSQETAAPDERAAPPDDADQIALSKSEEQGLFQRTGDIYNTHIGRVYTDLLSVGGQDDATPPDSEVIDDDIVRTHLRHFCEPARYRQAASQLGESRLVVLAGPDRTGRRCGAIALLTRDCPAGDMPQSAIIGLAPESTLPALVKYAFEPGGRYLLAGFHPDGTRDDQLQFRLRQLATRLATTGATLVITSNAAAPAFGSFAVPWEPVDCGAVLDAYLERRPDQYPTDTAAVLRQIACRRRPEEMERFLDVLERHGPEGVQQQFERDAADEVIEWINAAQKLPDLLPVVTAALLPGAPEPEHERHMADLHDAINEHAHRDPATRRHVVTLDASRANRPWWLDREPHPKRDLWVVSLRGRVGSRLVLSTLDRRYGRELWAPIRTWLRQCPGNRLDFDSERALGRGMAALLAVDRRLVHEVLDDWAAGPMPDRFAAAATVSALCTEDGTAPRALRTAIAWSTSREQRITAVLAFGQELSVRYPVEALSRLWHLTLRDQRVALYARMQLALCARNASRDPGRLRLAVSVLFRQLEHLLAEYADDPQRRLRGARTVAQALGYRPNKQIPPLTLRIVRLGSDPPARLGQMWAEVLRCWDLRADALDELRDTSEWLADDGESAAFVPLTEAIRANVSRAEWEWLCRDGGIPAWTAPRTAEVVA